ncbi:MAG: enhanced serine sensitivity protein SseB C-terminal domain-containing protein [Clostridiales bacterium]|nr:enhanced serine sensitivity protein SseB C-terminal domain-containing protein [Clostridiales bacterium]
MRKEDYILRETIDNKKLNALLNDVRTDPSEENMVELLREAAVSTFIVPLSLMGEDDDVKAGIQGMSNPEGKQYMVVFADSKSYGLKCNGEPMYGVTSKFDELIEVCMGNANVEGFVVNPGFEEVLFGKEMLSMIADMMHGGDDTAKVGEPDHYPEKLHEMLSEFLKVEPKVDKIWVRLMRINKGGTLSWLFIIEGSLGDTDDARKYVKDTLKNFIKPYLDGLELLVADTDEEYAKPVIEGVKPYIER